MLRCLLLAAISITFMACSTSSKPLEEVLPASIDGWKRTQVSAVDTTTAPELVKQLGVKRALAATYAGSETVTVRVYEMNVPTSAFELIQNWRQQDGLAVYSGPYFVVAEPGSGRETSVLLEGLRKQLP